MHLIHKTDIKIFLRITAKKTLNLIQIILNQIVNVINVFSLLEI